MTSPAATPEPRPAHAAAQQTAHERSAQELRAKVAALAEQVRQLGVNGGNPWMAQPRPAHTPAAAPTPPPPRAPGAGGAAVSAPASGERAGGRGEDPGAPAEEFARRSSRLLASVIETAELAAAEIRAGAEREAADIRERAQAAVAEADAALARYREALAALSVETARIEAAVVALREQARALEDERAQVGAALALLQRRPPR